MDIDYLSLINDLKDDVDSIYKTINSNSFLNMVDFINGSLTNGNEDTTIQHRIVSKYIVTCPYDLHIRIQTGYCIYISIYKYGKFSKETKYTDYANIKANTTFRIVIAKLQENQNEVADIETFCNAVTYNDCCASFKGEIQSRNNSYYNKLFNIHTTGIYTLNDYIDYWDDLPDYLLNSISDSDRVAILTIQNLKNNYITQTITTSSGYKACRLINISDGTFYEYTDRCQDSNGWYTETHYIDISNNSQSYDNKIYNIVNDGTYYIYTDVGWEDLPKGLSRYAILKVNKYCADFSFQKLYVFSKKSPTRIFTRNIYYDKSGPWNEWSEVSNIIKKPSSYLNTNAQEVSVYDLKKVSILGDSITTYAGFVPEENNVFYKGNNCGVYSVDDTWWMKTIKALNMILCVNNSWGGRTVSNLNDAKTGYINSGGFNTNTINALSQNYDKPDVIIIKLGINDFLNGVDLGTYNGTTEVPQENSSNMSKFRESYGVMLNKIMTKYPFAEVWCCTLMYCEIIDPSGFPEKNPDNVSLAQYNKAIYELANAFGAKIIDHITCGITYYNLKYCMGDYSSATGKSLHPNAKGHSYIANETIKQLDPVIRTRYDW